MDGSRTFLCWVGGGLEVRGLQLQGLQGVLRVHLSFFFFFFFLVVGRRKPKPIIWTCHLLMVETKMR